MYKILYIVSTLQKSGPTNQLYYIIKYLDSVHYSAHIITLSPEPVNSMKKIFLDIGITIDSLNLSRLNGFFKAKKMLLSEIEEINPDIIQTQGIRSDTLVNKLDVKIPSILTIRNYPFDDYKKKYGPFMGTYMAFNHIKVIKTSGNVVACSIALAGRLKNQLDLDLKYIQNGVDHHFYQPASQSLKLSVRNELKIGQDKIVFIHSGSLIKRKNISTIVNSFNRLDPKNNFLLLIIGSGPELDSLKKLAGHNNKIQFLGQKKNIIRYYHCADFMVSASLSEGLPNAILEGMSCGLPILLSDIDAHREIFADSGDFPFFFNPEDTEHLTDLIIKLAKEDYSILSKKMRQIIEDKFTADVMSKKYQKLYLELVTDGAEL